VKPSIAITPKAGPINRPLAAAGLFAIAAVGLCPDRPTDWHWYAGSAILAAISAALVLRGARAAVKDYRLRKAFAIATQVSDGHGSAREATSSERSALAMDRPFGNLLGLDSKGRPVWAPANAPFGLYEGPPGSGKTIAYVMGTILHHAALGYSLVVSDPKGELAKMTVAQLRKLGIEVWVFNPANQNLKDIGADSVGFYKELIDAVHGDAEQRLAAVKLAHDYAHIHCPSARDEKNPYFVQGSRRVLGVAILSEALLNPAKACPTTVYSLITDPNALMQRLIDLSEIEGLDAEDPIIEFLRVEARNLIARSVENPENYSSFCEGASQQLVAFNPAGRLAHYGAGSSKSFSALRERQVVVFLTTPLSHMTELAPAISLMNHNVISAVKANPTGHPVHIVAEEALVYKFHELTTNLETLRGLKVTADIFIQSFAGLEKAYGREAAQAIESYADVRVYTGINSGSRARYLSDLLSDVTLGKQDASFRTEMSNVSVSTGEYGRPLRKVNEILGMDRGKAWVFVRGLPPMNLQMVTYAEVAPWRDWVSVNPMMGKKLEGQVKVTIDYAEVRRAA